MRLPRSESTSLECLLSPLQVLFNQFKYFFNLYFLLLACSQFVPEMRLGALYTYWVPLVSQLGRPFGRIRGWAAERSPSFGQLEQNVASQRERTPPGQHVGSPRGFPGDALFCPPPWCLGSSFFLSVCCQVFPCFTSISRLLTADCQVLGPGTQWSRERQGLRRGGFCSLNCFLFMMWAVSASGADQVADSVLQ